MSSSKGLGSSAREMINLLPPEILRFLLVRTPYQKAIDFNPDGNTIPDLFDEYDRCAGEWFKHKRKSPFGRIFELSQTNGLPEKKMFFPRKTQATLALDFIAFFPFNFRIYYWV